MGSMIWVIGPAGRLPDRLSIRLQEFCLFPTQDYACAEDAHDVRHGGGRGVGDARAHAGVRDAQALQPHHAQVLVDHAADGRGARIMPKCGRLRSDVRFICGRAGGLQLREPLLRVGGKHIPHELDACSQPHV